MEKTDLTRYDNKPKEMINYLRYNGPHFSERLAEFAISKMKKNGSALSPIKPEDLKKILASAGVEIENGQLCDAWYVANMCKADFYGSAITDETRLAKFVKDYLDDEDGYDGIAFNRFLADCARKGVVINWADVV